MTHTHLLSAALAVFMVCLLGAFLGWAVIEAVLMQIDALQSLEISK